MSSLPPKYKGPDSIEWQQTKERKGNLYQFLQPFSMSKSGDYEEGDILYLVEAGSRKCYAFHNVTSATSKSYKAMATSDSHAIALINVGVLKEINYEDIEI